MNRCDYASCQYAPDTDVDGWAFCRRHLHEHRQLVASEAADLREREALAAAVSGHLLPSGGYDALLAALHGLGRQETAA